MTEKSQHGGKRDGAGRPRTLAEGGGITTLYLTNEDRALLIALGEGNMSEGLRRLIALHRQDRPG